MSKNKQKFFAISLIVVFSLSLIVMIPEKSTGRVIHVDDDGGADYQTISKAVENAVNGDTIIVYPGFYEGDIVLDKEIELIGQDKYNTILSCSADTALLIENDSCIVKNITIRDSKNGIKIESDLCTVSNCTIDDNMNGLVFYNSKNNLISNLRIQNCSTGITYFNDESNYVAKSLIESSDDQGIRMINSSRGMIKNCLINGSGYNSIYVSNSKGLKLHNNSFNKNQRGVYLYHSTDTDMRNNSLDYGLNLEGDLKKEWDSHHLINNSLQDGDIRYFVNSTGDKVIEEKGQLILVNCSKFDVKYSRFSKSEVGTILSYSSYNRFIGNNFTNNYQGIKIFNSENNTFHHNNIINNTLQVFSSDNSSYENKWSDDLGDGNFWDDYTGLDDGSNNRMSGDGVGDTNISHPFNSHGGGYYNLDENPLMESVVLIKNKIIMDNNTSDWHFISPGIGIGKKDIQDWLTLNSVDYEKILYYSSDMQKWKSIVDERADYFDDDVTCCRSTGFWIRLNSTTSFNYRGFIPARTKIKIYPGWNMVGIPIENNLSGMELPNCIEKVGTFNKSRKYNLEYLDTDHAVLEAGKGYWLYSLEENIITWNLPHKN